MSAPIPNLPDYCENTPNMASHRLGARALFTTNDFFAKVDRMLQDSEPVFDVELYDDNGKYMDGWESQRRRHGGHDIAIVKLAFNGQIQGVNICTKWFTGNYPKGASIEAGVLPENGDYEKVQWTEILSARDLVGDGDNFFPIQDQGKYNVVRLHIHPDGGVARLRVYGNAWADFDSLKKNKGVIELSSLLYGGRIIGYNNAHYGIVHNLLAPDKAVNMGDGWETRRRREPGYDWIVIALAHAGIIEKIEVDTGYYKGNYPDKCSINGGLITNLNDSAIITDAIFWEEILAPSKLSAKNNHVFDNISYDKPVSHIRLNIYPDGGVARLRIWGRVA